jgi:phosphoglycerol transferase MdoB-like AlkP superfamily enzyme
MGPGFLPCLSVRTPTFTLFADMTNKQAAQRFSRMRAGISRYLTDDRLRLWWLLAALFVGLSTLTRIGLVGVTIAAGQVAPANLPALIGIGTFFDVVTALSLFAPFGIYLALLPERVYRQRWHRWLMAGMCTATVFGLIYLCAVEYFFFDEFNSRFNFVAVEYLIYPHEVFVNIWQSYPVAEVLIATALITAALIWLARRSVLGAPRSGSSPLATRMAFLVALALLVGVTEAGLNLNTGRYSDNRVVNELAMNGVYSFFSAALNSELDYGIYYLGLPEAEASARLRKMVQTPDATFLAGSNHISRHIKGSGVGQRLNVVVLLEESLGAEFVGVYGDQRGLTPNIDRLAPRGMLFTRAYATGTRTVRGMEAVSASFPPVPAESIVKRRRNEHMFNWSTVMAAAGYAPTFIYGGFGTFDNMNYFFGANGYRVIDRTDLDNANFANIWGVSDEDLFRNAVRVFDEQHARGEKIFSIIMTTSNHKPYTFPPGIPGVPEKGGGRDAGVRYADYAIGRLFEMAQPKAWFDDTLFVIVADHGARVYGREDIPVRTYEIPLLLYSPRHIKPGRVDTLTSQIDIAPTVIGMLGFDYDSTFFGIDVLRKDIRPDRLIPLNHNRDIALFDGRNLYELGFRKTSAQYAYDPVTHLQTRTAIEPERMKDAIAVFQKAFEFYNERRYNIAGAK